MCADKTWLPTGTLSDAQLIAMGRERKLIAENFDERCVRQACYELRASNVYYDLADGKKKYELPATGYILVKPKQLVVVITLESLELPNNVLGRILTKGHLFSAGLLPVNTYADPGFSGRLGIVLYNVSNNYLKLRQGAPLAKIEFSVLAEPVEKPYAGQHGYQTQIWPIPEDMVLSQSEVAEDSRIGSSEEEIALSYGPDVAQVIKRVFGYERRIILAAMASLMLMVVLIAVMAKTDWLGPVSGAIIGVVANLATAGIFWLGTNLRRRRSGP